MGWKTGEDHWNSGTFKMNNEAIFKTAIYISLLFLAQHMFRKASDPPKCVRTAVRTEGVFATLIFLPAFIKWTMYDISIISPQLFYVIFFNLIGLFWFVLVYSLFHGRMWAKKTCLVLSVVRCFTIVGIPFSLISIISLRNKEVGDFFISKSLLDAKTGESEKSS